MESRSHLIYPNLVNCNLQFKNKQRIKLSNECLNAVKTTDRPTIYAFTFQKEIIANERRDNDDIRMNFVRDDSCYDKSNTKWCGFSFKP